MLIWCNTQPGRDPAPAQQWWPLWQLGRLAILAWQHRMQTVVGCVLPITEIWSQTRISQQQPLICSMYHVSVSPQSWASSGDQTKRLVVTRCAGPGWCGLVLTHSHCCQCICVVYFYFAGCCCLGAAPLSKHCQLGLVWRTTESGKCCSVKTDIIRYYFWENINIKIFSF